MTEKLKKINIHLQPEIEAMARREALAAGQSLSGWFRARVVKHLNKGDTLAQAAMKLNALEKDDDSDFNAETFERGLVEAQSKKRVF